jgi:hypothetical protein
MYILKDVNVDNSILGNIFKYLRKNFKQILKFYKN